MKRDRGNAVLGLSILFFLALSSSAYYKDNGYYDVNRLEEEVVSLRHKMDYLELENSRISRELEGLSVDGYYVESVARVGLGMVRPGEVVYEFVDYENLQNPLLGE